MKGRTSLAPPASRASPTISSPWPRYLDWSRTRSGTSWRHGPHHVAQKSRITTFPFRLDDATGFPSISGRVKEGAWEPTSPWPAKTVGPPCPWFPPRLHDAAMAARAQAKATRATPRRARAAAVRVRVTPAARALSQDWVVFIELVVGDPRPVIVPLDPLVLDEFLEDMLAQGVLHQARFLGQLYGFDQAPGEAFDAVLLPLHGIHLVDVLLDRRPKHQLRVHPLQPRGQHHGEGEVGVAGGIRAAQLDPGRFLLAGLVHGYPHQGRAVPLAPGDVHRRLEPGHQPLVRVHPLVGDRRDLAHVLEDSGQIRPAVLGQVVLVLGIEEHVLPALEERLVHVH